MTRPAVYDTDTDEMTGWGLACLAELRDLLVDRLADPRIVAEVLAIVDGYAAELVEDDEE